MKVSSAKPKPRRLAGWGRYPVIEGYEREGEDLASLAPDAVLSRGLGRSYGDASLPPDGDHVVVKTTRADRLLAFDPETGELRPSLLVFGFGWLVAVLWSTGFF